MIMYLRENLDILRCRFFEVTGQQLQEHDAIEFFEEDNNEIFIHYHIKLNDV